MTRGKTTGARAGEREMKVKLREPGAIRFAKVERDVFGRAFADEQG
jgi:hypothetical protein